jgi:hypothetical protein
MGGESPVRAPHAIPIYEDSALVLFRVGNKRRSRFTIQLGKACNQCVQSLRHVSRLAIQRVAQSFADALTDRFAVKMIEMDIVIVQSSRHDVFQSLVSIGLKFESIPRDNAVPAVWVRDFAGHGLNSVKI